MRDIRSNTAQSGLFDSETDARLMHRLKSISKVDLHRHLTGSIDAETATRVAAKYDVKFPTYLASELHEQLYGKSRVSDLEEYFVPWDILNKLFVSRESTREIILDVVRKAAEDNVVYLELRTSPRGFLGVNEFKFDEFLNAVVTSAAEAESLYGTVTRFIMGIPRHVFGRIPSEVRNRMFGQIVSMISVGGHGCFVGVDLNGVENSFRPDDFEYFFRVAQEKGFGITAHAGECGSASNVKSAVKKLRASRIGHGIAGAKDQEALEMLAERKCALEICPTSNQMLGVVDNIQDLPINKLTEYGVPFVICTDNPARCRTSMSEELFKIAKAFAYSVPEMLRLSSSALDYAFVDSATRSNLRSRLKGEGPGAPGLESAPLSRKSGETWGAHQQPPGGLAHL